MPRFTMAALLPLLLVAPALAHRGLITRASCDLDWASSAKALPIPDASISWSFKHYFDCSERAVWMKFQNPEVSLPSLLLQNAVWSLHFPQQLSDNCGPSVRGPVVTPQAVWPCHGTAEQSCAVVVRLGNSPS